MTLLDLDPTARPRSTNTRGPCARADAVAASPRPAPALAAGRQPGVQRQCRLIAFATAAAFAVPVEELTAPTRRSPYVAFARQTAMYLAHVALGLSYTEVAGGFDRDRTTAAYACRLVEERREDPAVDAVLGSLEQACGSFRRDIGVRVRP